MATIIDYAKLVVSLDIDQLLFEIYSREDTQIFIAELNTEDQLFDKGIDSDGVDLSSIGGEYSPVTVAIKKFMGQPTDRVTLKNDGDFHRSFEVKPAIGGFNMDADFMKDGQDLRSRWGGSIIGLTNDNLQKLAEYLNAEMVEEIEKRTQLL